ncbi:hypothetical protein EYR36_002366 [Pleurotus pulmonarius]|nr:hypothetical protein EYR36_002366 [Pleurotus pulmonarius]
MDSYERLSGSFPGSLTFQKVRPARSSGTLVTSVKYSPVSKSGSAEGMIAVADINGSLTIHSSLSLEIIRQYDIPTKAGSEVNEIRALAWNPRRTNELYVGFANGNIIAYEFDMGTKGGEEKDRTSRMCFAGPINDIDVNPSGLELAVAYGEDVALIQRPEFDRYNKPYHLSLAPNSQPRKLLYCGETSVVVVSLWNRPNHVAEKECPAAVAYFTHNGAIRWRIFTSAEDIILTAAITPSNNMITIAHAHSGAESYSLPQCQLLVKRNLYANENVNKEKFAVDMVFIDEDTVVVGGPSSTLTFTDVRSANPPTSTIEPPLGRTTYSFRKLDVLRDSRGGGFWLTAADSSILSEACDIMQFTDLPWPRDREATRDSSWLMRNRFFISSAVFVAWFARNQVLVLIKGILSYLIVRAFEKWSSGVKGQVITPPPPPPGGWKTWISMTNVSLFGLLVVAVGVRFKAVTYHLDHAFRDLWDSGRQRLAYVFQSNPVANSPAQPPEVAGTPTPHRPTLWYSIILLTEDFNNIVLEDVIKRVDGKSMGNQVPTPAMSLGPQSYTAASFPGAYPNTPAPHGGATDRSRIIVRVLRKVCDDEDTARLCAQLLSKARDGRDIKSKAPSLLKEYIVPQMNGEKLAEIVRELEALFDDETMPPVTTSDVYHPYDHNYSGSESISTYTPTPLRSNERVGTPLYSSSKAQTPIFIKPEHTTSIHLATTTSPINEQPHFQDPQQGPVEPTFTTGVAPRLTSLSPSPAHQSNTHASRASGSSTQAGTVETPPPPPQFTVLSLPPSSPQTGYVVNPPLSPRMSAPPAGTASWPNEQRFVYSIPVLFTEEVTLWIISRVTELAAGVNATAPVGPVAHVQGPSTTFLVDPQGKVLRRDAGGSLQSVAELVYHNKDKGILEKGAGNYKSRVIECRRTGPATFNSPIVPANWPKLTGDLFMVHALETYKYLDVRSNWTIISVTIFSPSSTTPIMRTRPSANWNPSVGNVSQPRRTRSSVSRSLGVRYIIPRPSTQAVALVGDGSTAARPSRPLGPIRHNKRLNSARKDRTTVLGWLFDNCNMRYQARQFDVKPGRNAQSIPEMDVFPVFLAPSRVPIHEATVSLSSSHRHRFRIYGYTDSGTRVNEALRLVSPHILWRGEIAVFQLGQVVPYLGRPSVNARVAHKAVRLFMAAVITAIDSHSTMPKQILE